MCEFMFGQRLSSLRMDKGVSARDMSLSLGQSAGYINALENQKSLPSMQTFYYICDYLNVTPAEFFDTGNKHPQDYREIISALNKLDPETQKAIKTILKKLSRQLPVR